MLTSLIYTVSSNICQEVNRFSHELLDRVQDVIATFFEGDERLGSFRLSQNYLWLRYHADLLKIKSEKTFIGSEVRYKNTGTLRQTRLHSVVAQVSAADKITMGEAEIIYFFDL